MAGFSYAEAAKGRVPAPVATPALKQDQIKEQSVSTTTAPTASSEKKPATEVHAQTEIERNDSEETLKVDIPTDTLSKASTSKSHSISNASGTESPSLTDSAATLLKDYEINGNAIDSESTTWERVSQSSQHQDKASTKSNAAGFVF